jgi:predicted ATPase
VGRRRELAEVDGLVRSRRLVTLTGPPGVGKTRLALETAQRVAGEHPHGVFFVSLAEVETPALLPAVISAALRVPASDQSLDGALMAHLRPRRVLLVLDNFEHVAPGAELVGRLLDAAPGLVVLATSRMPLRLSGEQEYPLGPLPAAAYDEVAADRTGVDALTLFVDRARAVDPDFALTADNGPLVAEIVNRLDRLPLAIELAAPRLRGVPLVELNAQLSSRLLAGLADGPIDAPARQRTLADAIDWSHDLLDPADQAAFRRLAVFRGGFTLEAAAAVAAGPPIEDVGGAVSRLVDASLVERPVEAGPARFALLETIRDYGLWRLEAAGETGAVLRRHADFHAQLVAQAEHELTGPAHHEWLARLTAEYANVRAVFAWAGRAQPGDRELALLMAGGMWRFWQCEGS